MLKNRQILELFSSLLQAMVQEIQEGEERADYLALLKKMVVMMRQITVLHLFEDSIQACCDSNKPGAELSQHRTKLEQLKTQLQLIVNYSNRNFERESIVGLAVVDLVQDMVRAIDQTLEG